VTRPILLDLFCGRTGGAARGYQLAGFRVVGADIVDCPDYVGDEFYKIDALDLLREAASGAFGDVRAAHASPPCQGRGGIANGTMPKLRDLHPNMIPSTREALEHLGLPYVIENVQQSGVRPDVTLCGEMFGLGVIMHRHFELGGWSAEQPEHLPHRGYVRGWRHGVWRDGPYVAAYGRGGGKATVDEMREAKGIDWSRDHLGLWDALPPDYTRWIGERLIKAISDGGS